MTKTTIETVKATIKELNKKEVLPSVLNGKLEAINEQIKEVNAETTKTRINELIEKSKTDNKGMFMDFINNATADVVRLAQDKETNDYTLADTTKQISFYDLLATAEKQEVKICKGHDGFVKELIAIFMHNLYLAHAEELKVQGVTSKKISLSESYNKTRFQYQNGLFNSCSIGKMEEQLNHIIETMLPEDLQIKMLKADVRYLKAVAIKVGDKTAVITREKKFVNELFNAMFIRMNKKAYDFTSKMESHVVEK